MVIIVPPTSGVSAAMAAQAAAAEKRVLDQFRNRGARSKGAALAYAPESAAAARALVRLLDRGVLIEAEAGRYWFDQKAFESGVSGQQRVKRAVMLVAAAVALVLAGALLLLRGG